MEEKKDQFQTRYSLLERAVDLEDQQAWEDLASHYRALIYRVAKDYRITDTDADDLVSEVMITLSRKIATYDRSKGKFRSWLGRIMQNQARMNLRKSKTMKSEMNRPSGNSVELLNIAKDSELENKIEEEWRAYAVELAEQRLQDKFPKAALDIFSRTMQGQQAPEIAKDLKISVNTVYVYKGRLKEAFREEIRNIETELGE